ncbi:cytochrome P450 [Aureobasidium pullulans]|nr:cytochrome P450 [Aureobasidium pullulans]
MRRCSKEVPNNGLLRYYMVGNIERILVTEPRTLNEVLIAKAYDFMVPQSLRIKFLRFTGDGILLAQGDKHKTQRKGLLPSFSYRRIKNLYPTFWSKSVEVADAIKKYIDASPSPEKQEVQIRDWAHRVTLDIIGTAGMGHDFGAIQNPELEFHQRYKSLALKPSTGTRLLMLIVSSTIGFERIFQLPTRWNRESKAAASYIRGVAREIVHEKRYSIGDAQGKDIATTAISSGLFSEEEMVNQMMTLLVAGHETIAASLQWAVYALCSHPHMQIRLREEIRTYLPCTVSKEGEPAPKITATQIDTMPYLNAFCSEVFRFYPPVPSTIKEARVDTTIAGTFIPKGTTMLIPIGSVNLDQNLWGPDASEFKPERWLGECRSGSGGASSNHANLTFLTGPRGCLGQTFARSELLCLVAVLVGRFEFIFQDPTKKIETIRSISISPKDGVLVNLRCIED